MISYPDAVARILREASPLPARSVPLHAVAGCVTAAPVLASMDVPGFDNAAMDGFAIAAADTAGIGPDGTVELPVAGTIMAGSPPPGTAAPGAAWEIMTGAPLPPGCDAVIPVERSRASVAASGVASGAASDAASDAASPTAHGAGRAGGAPARIRLSGAAHPGDNIRRAGADFRAGGPVLAAGTTLEAHSVMGLAACGCDHVLVRPLPRVAILTTGSELTDQGIPTAPGMIRDANGPYLLALLRQLGSEPAGGQTVADTLPALRASLAQLAGTCDVIVTTGGVSAGRMDMVPTALKDSGGEIIFHKVAIRPGKPLLFARLPSGQLFFGLPGNPMAVAVGMRFFVIPALRALQGLPVENFPAAVCSDPIRSPGELHFFGKARAEVDGTARLVVRLLPGQESFRISPLLQANCWVIVPAGQANVQPGERVRIAPLYPAGFRL